MGMKEEAAALQALLAGKSQKSDDKAPQENGQRLATIQRADDEELRLNWSEFKGRHFLNIRVWKKHSDGSWYPQKDKGLTVRKHELPGFAVGVSEAIEAAKAEGAA